MKQLITCLLLSASSYLVAQPAIQSTINHVTVFQTGAQVSREANANIVAGNSELVITGLSTNIDPNTIQVEGVGNFVIQSVQHRINYLQSAESSNKQLQEQLKKLEEKLNAEQNNMQIIETERMMIEKNMNQIIGVPNSNTKLEDLKQLIEFQKLRLQDLLPKRYASQKKLDDIQEDIVKIHQQMQDIQNGNQKPSGEFVLSISANQAVKGNFVISYYIPQASWQMYYDIRVKDITKPMDIIYKASVTQQSGEDWKNVTLSLSTGNPRLSGTRPVLNPWFLRNTPVITNQYRNYQKNAVPSSQNYAVRDAASGAEATIQDLVTETENITSRLYTIDLKYTIKSGEKPMQVSVKEVNVAADYEYYAVPKLDKDAFLTAIVKEWEELNLISGEANLFFEGVFQGKSFIDVHSINDFLRISLGRDKNVVIERNKIKDYTKNQFLSDNKLIKRGWEFVIKNKRSTPIKLILEDQLPLSTGKEISIDREELSGASVEEETGKLRWEFNLKGSEQKKIPFKYSVKCPKDYTLNLEY